jgi:hypothetical protein
MKYKHIPGDDGLPMPAMMMAKFETGEHLLADDISTMAVEGMANDGSHWQPMIVVEAQGRLNKTSERAVQKMSLSKEAAIVLMGNLYHSLQVLEAQSG